MATTYGRLAPRGKAEVTRQGGKEGISAKLETWTGAVFVSLAPDGTFVVQIGDKGNPCNVIATGNVDAAKRHATGVREGKQPANLYGTAQVRRQHART